MEENAEEFEMFHADEDDDEESESFASYVSRMRNPGRWGSQLELMALCRRYGVNAIVHQSGLPAYEMVFAPRDARCIQLSYHDGEHYNSIRFAWDLVPETPAQHLSLAQLQGAAGEGAGQAEEESEDIRQVRECLPPDVQTCAAAIRAALSRSGGDVSAAAECLLSQELGGEGGVAPSGASGDASASNAPADAAAAASGGEVGGCAGGSDASADAAKPRATRAERKAGRRQAKEVAEQKRRAAKVAGPPDPGEADEHLSLLSQQLLSV